MLAAIVAPTAASGTEEGEYQEPEPILQEPVERPINDPDFEHLPFDRGEANESILSGDLDLNLPVRQILDTIKLPSLPELGPLVPLIDLFEFLESLPLKLPSLDLLDPLSLIENALALVKDRVSALRDSVRDLGAGIQGTYKYAYDNHNYWRQYESWDGQAVVAVQQPSTSEFTSTASARSTTTIGDGDALPQPSPTTPSTPSSPCGVGVPVRACYSLTSEAQMSSGTVRNTFQIALCVPTSINIQKQNPSTADGVNVTVFLCPVPLGYATSGTPQVPPVVEPVQLYFGVQRLATGTAVRAKFTTNYDVPDPAAPTQTLMTLQHFMDSNTVNYPSRAVFGAATSYNPAVNSSSQSITKSWLTSGKVDTMYVRAVGKGRIRTTSLVADSGSFRLQTTPDRATATYLTTSAYGSSSPSIEVIANRGAGDLLSAVLTLSALPKELSLTGSVLQAAGKPAGLKIEGSQPTAPNGGLTFQLDINEASKLIGRFRQVGFGAAFTETLEGSVDSAARTANLKFTSQLGAGSTAYYAAYDGESTVQWFALMAGIPADASEISVTAKGEAGTASGGVTLHAAKPPAYAGYASYMNGSTRSSSQQVALLLTRGTQPSSLPFTVSQGAKFHFELRDTADVYDLDVSALNSGAAGSSVSGVELRGSTPSTTVGARMARQMKAHIQADPSHRVSFLANSLGRQWTFKTNLHGPTSAPTGLDVSNENLDANSAEFKQIYVSRDGSGLFSFTLSRTNSDRTGEFSTNTSIALAVSNPPYSADIAADKNAQGVGGVLSGRNVTTSASGYAQLTASGVTLKAENLFGEVGEWSVTAGAQLMSDGRSIEGVDIVTQQSWGKVAGAKITVTAAGVGRIGLEGLTTRSRLAVQFVRSNGSIVGARLDAFNRGSDPSQPEAISTQEAHVEKFNASGTTEIALNMLGTGVAASEAVTGTLVTATVTETPAEYGFTLSRPTANGLAVASHLTTARPNMKLDVTAKPDATFEPGSKIRLIVKAFDVGTTLDAKIVPQDAAGNATAIKAIVSSTNVNANSTHVVNAALVDSAGNAKYALLLARPSAVLTGLYTSGSEGTISWEKAPQSYDLDVDVFIPAPGNTTQSTSLKIGITNATASTDAVLKVGSASENVFATLRGTAATQHFTVDTAPSVEGSSEGHFTGSLPSGAHNIQVHKKKSNHEELLFTFYKDGTTDSGNNKGVEVKMYPVAGPQDSVPDFDVTVAKRGKSAEVRAANEVPGSRMIIEVWHNKNTQTQAVTYCKDANNNAVPCTKARLDSMPATIGKLVVQSVDDAIVPSIDYQASSSSLVLTLESLSGMSTGLVRLEGIPSKGISLKGQREKQGFTLEIKALAAENPVGERLPKFYLRGENIQLPVVVQEEQPTSDYEFSIGATIDIALMYKGRLVIEGDAGLAEARIIPTGILGGLAAVALPSGTNAKMTATIDMKLAQALVEEAPVTSHVNWSWVVQAPLAADEFGNVYPVVLDQESRNRNFSIGSRGVLSMYTWEPWTDDERAAGRGGFAAAGTGCTNKSSASDITKSTKRAGPSGIPFQPTFPQVNNSIQVCGGHVLYSIPNPQDSVFKLCSTGLGETCAQPFSFASLGGTVRSDWMFAAAIKQAYPNPDPAELQDHVEQRMEQMGL